MSSLEHISCPLPLRVTSLTKYGLTGMAVFKYDSHTLLPSQLRIDVSQSSDVPEVRPYIPGTPLNPPSPLQLLYPIKLTPRHRNNFFVPPQSFNALGMLQNPMMLMMVFGGGMMLAMPYLVVRLPLHISQVLDVDTFDRKTWTLNWHKRSTRTMPRWRRCRVRYRAVTSWTGERYDVLLSSGWHSYTLSQYQCFRRLRGGLQGRHIQTEQRRFDGDTEQKGQEASIDISVECILYTGFRDTATSI